jgi:hypothetical protein
MRKKSARQIQMNGTNKILILLLTSLLSCTIPPKKADWERYQETTLKEFISYFSADTIINEHPILKIVGADAPFKTKVNYIGKYPVNCVF